MNIELRDYFAGIMLINMIDDADAMLLPFKDINAKQEDRVLLMQAVRKAYDLADIIIEQRPQQM